MTFRTPLCDLLDIEYPILLAGMGGGSGPELAAAVSNAGGLGVLGAAACSPAMLDEWITRTRKLRRNVVQERYAPIIDAIYGGRTNVAMKAQVVYETGEVGATERVLTVKGV